MSTATKTRPRKSTTDIPLGMSADIAGFLSLLRQPGEVFEIRAPKCPYKRGDGPTSTHSGYFADPTTAHSQIALLDAKQPPGVYVTMNPVRSDLLARSANKIIPKAEHTTADADIERRELLLIDIDPRRPAGVSATDAEMQAALDLAYHVRDDLAADGWTDAVLCMSGNGAYLLYRIELPNDDDATDLVKRTLHGLAERYDTDAAEIDCSTFNAGRICKLIGTTARKGSHLVNQPGIEDRPHRQSWYEPPTTPINPVPRDLLEAVAAAPANTENPAAGNGTTSGSNAFERCRKYVLHCPNAVNGDKGHNSTLRAACECFRFGLSDAEAEQIIREYNATKTVGEQWTDNEMAHKIAEARKKVEADGELGIRLRGDQQGNAHQQESPSPESVILSPGTQVRPRDRDNVGTVISDNGRTATVKFVEDGVEVTKTYPKSALGSADGSPLLPGPRKTLDVIHVRDFVANDYRPKWLVKNMLVAKNVAVGAGRSKAMKTSIFCDLAVSVATGTPFLGVFETAKSTVAMLSGESGAFTIQETVKRIVASRAEQGLSLSNADLYFGFDLPQITSWDDVDATATMMLNTKADVLIVDPAYLCLLGGDSGGRQASNVFDMGPILLRLSEVGQQTDSTVILIHHCRKSPTEGRDRYDPPELEDMAMAGFAEWARQWVLIGRRERFEPGTGNHKLWLNTGGSVGMSGTWSVDIDEGVLAEDFTGRRWDVTVGSATEAREAKKVEQQKRDEIKREGRLFECRQKVIRVLRANPEGLSKTKLKDKTAVNTGPLSDVLMDMQQRGEVRCFDGKSGSQPCDIYALTDQAG